MALLGSSSEGRGHLQLLEVLKRLDGVSVHALGARLPAGRANLSVLVCKTQSSNSMSENLKIGPEVF